MSGDESQQIKKALGNLAILADQSVKQHSPKLSLPQFDQLDEVTAFLVTYVFDLQRRMEYLFLALAEFGPAAEPHLARRVKSDFEYVNEGTVESLSWRERAKRAQELLLKIHEEVGPAHHRLLNYVAGVPETPSEQA
jgi:hypothetical protein